MDVEFQQSQEELSLLVETVMRRVYALRMVTTDKPDQKEMEIRMGILSWIVVGMIAGWLAGKVFRR